MKRYRLRQGECLLSVAKRHGFSWETLWNHPENRDLQRARESAFVLQEGDEIVIPERTAKEQNADAGSRHRFRRKGATARLQVILEENGEALANTSCNVTIDGNHRTVSTDGNGLLDIAIPANAREGTVRVGEGDGAITYQLQLRHLDPHDSISGVQQRLRNLGFYQGEVSGESDAALTNAMRIFCQENGIDENAAQDQVYQEIRDAHGS